MKAPGFSLMLEPVLANVMSMRRFVTVPTRGDKVYPTLLGRLLP
jgi:hypothetical protein